jgi:hypothetical protein
VLYPAVDPLVPFDEPLVPPSARWGIVVLGRFFQGRQNKGHRQAIQLFHQVRMKLTSLATQDDLKLVLMGYPMPGQV